MELEGVGLMTSLLQRAYQVCWGLDNPPHS